MLLKKIFCSVFAIMLLVPVFGSKASADNFTPSISVKPAPVIIGVDKKTEAIIYDKNGKPLMHIPYGEIIITPIKRINQSKYEDIKTNLGIAHSKMSVVESLFDVCPDFEDLVKEEYPDLTVEELVVKDIFHLAVYGTYRKYLLQPGNHLNVTFETSIASDEPFFALFHPDGNEWVARIPEYTNSLEKEADLLNPTNTDETKFVVSRSGENATIRFDTVGTVAFITRKTTEVNVDPENPEVESPPTGDTTQTIWGSLLSIAILLGGGFLFFTKFIWNRVKKVEQAKE